MIIGKGSAGKRREGVYHFRQAPRRNDVPGVDEAVQMPGRFFYRLAHLVVAVEIEHVGHEVQRILVVLDLSVEARQVEAVRQVLLVDLTKVLVAAGRDELGNRVLGAKSVGREQEGMNR
jgi:hypothetical protein